MALKGGQKFVIALTTIFTAAGTAFLVYAHMNFKKPEEEKPILDWILTTKDVYKADLDNREVTPIPLKANMIASFYAEAVDPEVNVGWLEEQHDVPCPIEYNSLNKCYYCEGCDFLYSGYPTTACTARGLIDYEKAFSRVAGVPSTEFIIKYDYYYGIGFRVKGEIYSKEDPEYKVFDFDYICDLRGWPIEGKCIGHSYAHDTHTLRYDQIAEYRVVYEEE